MKKIWIQLAVLLITLALMGSGNRALSAEEGNDSTSPSRKDSNKSLSDRVRDLEKKLESSDQKFEQVREDQLRLHFNVYGDAEYHAIGPSGSFPQSNGFSVGQTDLHIMGRFGPRLSFMSEDVVEFDGQDPVIDLERILVSYSFSDAFRLGAGRDHTCFGYWNRTFHHGSHLQTTIDRPFFLRFEDGGGSTPSHIVGLFASGSFDLGGPSLKYEFNVGNGQSIGLEGDGAGNVIGAAFNLNPTGDNNNDKSYAARLVLKPIADSGLAIGAAAVWNQYDVLPPDDPSLAGNPLIFTGMGQWLLEAEVIYIDENFEFLSEFYNFDNAVAGSPTQGSAKNTAFYVQAAYQVSADWKPYVRIENLNVDGTDPYFLAMGQHNQTIVLAGLRYELVPVASSMKLEIRSINNDGNYFTELAGAWGFGF